MLIVVSICLLSISYKYHKLNRDNLQIIEINGKRQEQNKQLDIENKQLETTNQGLKDQYNEIVEQIEGLSASAERMKQNSEQRAQEQFQAKYDQLMNQLSKDHEAAVAAYQLELSALAKKKEFEQSKLQDIENKQLAYLEAQKRQEEMKNNQDFYRLVINDIDLEDVKMLRELQVRFSHKDSIDKLIWENYYKPAYDALMARLFGQKTKVCGIYKITDTTTGLSYIGQSVDIKERFRQHIKTSLTYGVATNKLYQALQCSEQSNFTFEILEEVDRSKLNEREIYWIDFYKTKEFGLNKTIGGS